MVKQGWEKPTYLEMSFHEFYMLGKEGKVSILPHLAPKAPFDAQEARNAIYGIIGANVPGGLSEYEIARIRRGQSKSPSCARRARGTQTGRQTGITPIDPIDPIDLSDLDLSDLIGNFTAQAPNREGKS